MFFRFRCIVGKTNTLNNVYYNEADCHGNDDIADNYDACRATDTTRAITNNHNSVMIITNIIIIINMQLPRSAQDGQGSDIGGLNVLMCAAKPPKGLQRVCNGLLVTEA